MRYAYTRVCRASQVVLVIKEPPASRRCERHGFSPWVGKVPWRRAWQPFHFFFAWRIPWIGVWRASVHRVAKSQAQLKWLNTYYSLHYGINTTFIHPFGNQKFPMTRFVAVFALLWWSGTERTRSPGMPAFILPLSPTAHQGLPYTEASPWEQ